MAFISCSIFLQRPAERSKQRSAALTQTASTPRRPAASLGSPRGGTWPFVVPWIFMRRSPWKIQQCGYSNVIGTTHQIDGWNPTQKNDDEWFMTLVCQHYKTIYHGKLFIPSGDLTSPWKIPCNTIYHGKCVIPSGDLT